MRQMGNMAVQGNEMLGETTSETQSGARAQTRGSGRLL